MKIDEVKLAVNAAASDANVLILLRYLRVVCGMDAPPLVIRTDGEIAEQATFYNMSRSMVYIDFKKLMSAETENLVTRRENVCQEKQPLEPPVIPQ